MDEFYFQKLYPGFSLAKGRFKADDSDDRSLRTRLVQSGARSSTGAAPAPTQNSQPRGSAEAPGGFPAEGWGGHRGGVTAGGNFGFPALCAPPPLWQDLTFPALCASTIHSCMGPGLCGRSDGPGCQIPHSASGERALFRLRLWGTIPGSRSLAPPPQFPSPPPALRWALQPPSPKLRTHTAPRPGQALPSRMRRGSSTAEARLGLGGRRPATLNSSSSQAAAEHRSPLQRLETWAGVGLSLSPALPGQFIRTCDALPRSPPTPLSHSSGSRGLLTLTRHEARVPLEPGWLRA